LSGWPSVTDSEVNKKFRKASLKTILLLDSLRFSGGYELGESLSS
jgi:hypothetical protein